MAFKCSITFIQRCLVNDKKLAIYEKTLVKWLPQSLIADQGIHHWAQARQRAFCRRLGQYAGLEFQSEILVFEGGYLQK